LCAPGAHTSTSALDQLAIDDPNRLVDPVHDPGFKTLATFGNDAGEVSVFQFDLRQPPR